MKAIRFFSTVTVALAMMMALGTVPARAQVMAGYPMLAYPEAPGDLLLGYLYDVRLNQCIPGDTDCPMAEVADRDVDTWENYMVIQNTTNAWVAAHLRFRAYQKSIEVWDHIILLSPYDVFWADLRRLTTGGTVMYSADTHTLVNSGIIKSTETDYLAQFSTQLLADCGFTENLEAETEFGEVEVIGMWQINSTSHDLSAVLKDKNLFDKSNPDVNGDGQVNALDVLAAVYPNPDTQLRPGDPYPLVDCSNSLTANMELGDINTGQYRLYNFTPVQFFRTDVDDVDYHRDGYLSGVILYPDSLLFGRNYFADATHPAYYYNPDWATTTGPTLRDGNASFGSGEPLCVTNGGTITAGLDPFNAAWSIRDLENQGTMIYSGLTALWKNAVWGFFLEDAYGANIMTNVVLSFPTKYLHYLHYKVGEDCDDLAAGKQWPFWDGTVGVGTYNDSVIKYRKDIKAQWDKVSNGPVLLQNFDIWDLDQNKPQAISGPSPHPLFDIRIPHEVNVMDVVTDIFGPIFEGSDQAPFSAGQFTLGGFTFNAQMRDYSLVVNDPDFNAGLGAGAVLGATVRIHEMPGSSLFRSTIAPLVVDKFPAILVNTGK